MAKAAAWYWDCWQPSIIARDGGWPAGQYTWSVHYLRTVCSTFICNWPASPDWIWDWQSHLLNGFDTYFKKVKHIKPPVIRNKCKCICICTHRISLWYCLAVTYCVLQRKSGEVRAQRSQLKHIEDLSAGLEERLILDNRWVLTDEMLMTKSYCFLSVADFILAKIKEIWKYTT